MVKITRESNSTVVEATKHTSVTTFGVRQNIAITKGYVCSQDGAGNASLALGRYADTIGAPPDPIGTMIGIADESVTGSTTGGGELIRIIDHGWAWVSSGIGAIAMGAPVKVSTVPGLITQATYGTDQNTWIIGNCMVSTSVGSDRVLVNLWK